MYSRCVPAAKKATVILSLLALAACSTAERLSRVGKAPDLTTIENPVAAQGYQPVTLPMPRPDRASYQANSLWRAGAKSFFDDQRADQVGDILTVLIDITDKASLDNTTSRSRANSEDADLTSFLGLQGQLAKFLPDAVSPSNLTAFGSNSSTAGSGNVDREEKISLTVAAIVTQALPNGNFVIQGRQEVRVNHEVRELFIAGVVRPEDISNTNTIQHTQIAEARVSYGGRGIISDVQQPRYGQQIYDIIFPF